MNPNQKLIDSLRQAADFLEQHPELPECHENEAGIGKIGFHLYGEDSPWQAKKIIRSLGGRWKKDWYDTFATISRQLAPLVKVCIFVQRDAVCQRVEKKKLIPAQPERVLPAEPEREEVEVEWVCDGSLLGAS